MVVEHVEVTEVITLESVAIWPDGEWCFTSELEEMDHKSDDYAVMPYEYAVSRGYIEEAPDEPDNDHATPRIDDDIALGLE